MLGIAILEIELPPRVSPLTHVILITALVAAAGCELGPHRLLSGRPVLTPSGSSPGGGTGVVVASGWDDANVGGGLDGFPAGGDCGCGGWDDGGWGTGDTNPYDDDAGYDGFGDEGDGD